MKFNVGDKVVKNPDTWVANDFDSWSTVREEIEASRNLILQRAADFVLGKRGQVWLLCEHRANRGRRDDRLLEEVLSELDLLRLSEV
jgi:hypothetical protein